MKIIETGNTYKVYGEDLVVLDHLPAKTYKVGFSEFTGFFLERIDDLQVNEGKVYGVREEKANKVLRRFNKASKNLGVILSGDKGIGKSLFARLLSEKALAKGLPVILVDKFVMGLADFLDRIKNEALVLFDEFDKNFAIHDDDDPQATMLSLFDGTSSGKKLFVITCNDYEKLNDYLLNRPGRFHFHIRFDYPTDDEIREYLTDKLDSNHEEIEKVVEFSHKVKLNYDCLSAIALELNEGERFESAIEDLNIVNTDDAYNYYDLTLYTEEGIVFSRKYAELDLFSKSESNFWLDDSTGNAVKVTFNVNDMQFDTSQGKFSLSKDEFSVYCTARNISDGNPDKFKNLTYTRLDIALNYGSDIHYKLV